MTLEKKTDKDILTKFGIPNKTIIKFYSNNIKHKNDNYYNNKKVKIIKKLIKRSRLKFDFIFSK